MYRCRPLPDRPAAGIAKAAPPNQTIHPMKIPSRLCSQSRREGWISPVPDLRRLRQSNVQLTPGLLRGCVRERNRDAKPETPRKAPAHVPVLREKPPPTCDETPAWRWPGSPDSCYGWPLGQFHISPANPAWRHIVPGTASTAATAGGWKKKSGTYWLQAGTPVPPPSQHRRPSKCVCRCAEALAWVVRLQPTKARPSC